MYNIELTEHFEDFYVIEHDKEEFSTIEDALEAFKKEADNILNNNIPPYGIKDYIEENLKDCDADISDDSKGFVLFLKNHEDILFSLHFDYDHISDSVIGFFIIELDEDKLSMFDLSEYRQKEDK